MPINITMPALSPTMEEGNLAKWLVKEGDKVSPGDVIAEIETDKATMEVEAVDEGTVAKLVVPAGTEGVKVNALIAVLASEGEDASAAAKTGGDATPAKAEAPKADAPKAEEAKATPAKSRRHAKPRVGGGAPAAAPASNGHAAGERTFASPLARRVAKDAGIDVSAVTGSGPHGRVVKADVEAAIAGGGAKAAPAAKPAPGAAPATAAAPAPKAMSDDAVLKLFEQGSYELDPARQHAQDHRAAAGRGQVDDPAFLPDARLRTRRAAGATHAAQRRSPDEEDGQGRRAGLQAVGQRHGHQGDGVGIARRADRQRILDGKRHGAAQARRCRRRRLDPRWADHPDHSACRHQDAVGHCQ